jgi:tripartite ATP-independent transporter DctM subunit
MFLSGIVPGILIGILQMIWSAGVARRYRIGEVAPFSARRLLVAGRAAWPALLIPVIVIGGILGGVFTATEASVIAVLYVLLLSVLNRRLSFGSLVALTEDSIGLFSLSLLCVAAASLWGWLLAFYAVPQSIVTWLSQADMLTSPLRIFTAVVIIFLIIGTFMDAVPAIIIMQPIIGAIAKAAGIDPYHMGLVVVLTLAIGLITPPYGLCLLIAADLGEISVGRAMRSMVPFYIISLIVVALAILFPGVMLWIPRLALAQLMP